MFHVWNVQHFEPQGKHFRNVCYYYYCYVQGKIYEHAGKGDMNCSISQLAHERGVALRWSMLVITCLHLVTLVSTFFFLPRGFISKAAPVPVQEVMQNETSVELLKRKDHTDKEKGKMALYRGYFFFFFLPCIYIGWENILNVKRSKCTPVSNVELLFLILFFYYTNCSFGF